MHNPACFAAHMGLWLVDPTWMAEAVAWARGNPQLVSVEKYRMHAAEGAKIVETPNGGAYAVHPGGVASVSIVGQMMKGPSKFGGTSTVAVRSALRAAARDKEVSAIVLSIDSPGGHVAGTQELADDVAAVNETTPILAHIDDLGASAAYWVASQASSISVNRSGMVGSIGVMTSLIDSSGKAEAEGIKVIPVTSGPLKGAGMPGTEVTEEQIAETQSRVDAMAAQFFEAVKTGRGMDDKALAKVNTGAVFTATEALDLGLVDHVRSMDATASAAFEMAQATRKSRANRSRQAYAKLDMLDLH